MTYFKGLKKIGVNTTVLATSVALVACGGGGGGYYGNTGSSTDSGNSGNPSTPTTTKEVAGVTLQLSKGTLKVQGDELVITAKAVDKDSGGVAGAKINLNIKDGEKNGATSDASTKTTGDDGTVTFTVKLNGSNKNLTELVFTATVVDTKIQNQIKATVTGAGTVVQSQYELKFDDVSPLQVSGGETVIRIRTLDTNGGGVPNEKVALNVKDFKTNGVTIKGASSAVTDNEGYVSFTLALPQGKEADRLALIASGIALEATLTEQSGAVKTQISTAQVVSVKSVMSSLSLSTSSNNKVDAIGGMIEVEATAKNPEGLAVEGKDISLKLDDLAIEYGAKLITPTVKTDANGKAKFTIKTEANSLNPTGQLLVNNGIKISATSIDGSVVTQTSTISVVSVATESVSFLNAVSSNSIDVSGGQAIVTVTAKDAKGGAVANKQISLTVPNSQSNGLTIVEGSKLNTDNNGQAQFTVKFDKNSVSLNDLNNLVNNGVTVAASYTTVNNNVLTQTTRLNFTNKNAILEKDVQRLELTASKGVVSAKNDTVQVKVRAISADGGFVANKLVTLGLASAVNENGVTIGGDKAITQKTDASGYATFTLNVDAYNQQSIDNLVQSGITIAVGTTLADGSSVKQNMQIMVEAAPLQAVDVSYLSISSDSMINTNKGQTTVTVRAVDRNGGVLANQDITLNIDKAKEYGLTIITGSKAKTNAQGEATFVIQYDGLVTDASILSLLKTQGVLLTATYQPTIGAAITQTSYVRYYDQTSDVDVKQLSISLAKGVAVASNDIFEVAVKAVDENGQPINGRKINLTLSDIAKNNGVQIVTAPAKVTENGEAKFTIQLKAPNTDAVNALVAAGLLITATAQQNSGTSIFQTAKVMVAASVQGTVDVAYLAIEQLDAINVANNAERVITVRAYNSSGVALANKDIVLNLPQFTGIRIKENSILTTNAAGEVKFTVVYDPSNLSDTDKTKLIQDGLVINANYNNVSQTVKLAYFESAKNIQRMDLTVDEPVLVVASKVAQQVKAKVTLKDDAGKPIAGRQVTLAINQEELQNGVAIDGALQGSGTFTVSTDVNGQYEFTLFVNPKDVSAVSALVSSGVNITASAIQADGTNKTQNTKVNILSQAVVNEVGYLTLKNSNDIKTTGGSSTITVSTFNSNGMALSGKVVKLALKNVPTGLDIQLDAATNTTNANGTANFVITYKAPKVLTPEQIKGLLAGIQVVASYTNSAGVDTTQNLTQQFIVDQVNIQRMDLVVDQPNLILDKTSSKTVETTVTLKDKDGNLIKDRQVTLAIDNWAVDNNIIKNSLNFKDVIGGLTVVKTDDNGQAKVLLEVNTTTKEAVDALVASGISLSAIAVQGDGTGSISQKTQITVSSAATLNEISYLTTDNTKGALKTTGDSTNIIVKAFNNKGKAIAGKLIKLALNNVPAGLNIKVTPSSQVTAADGSANFAISYTAPANLTAEQIKGLLAGIQATATYTSEAGTNITQSTVLQFVADDAEIAKDAQRIELLTSKGIVFADNDTFTFTTKVFDKDGNPLKDKLVGFGLNAAAVANGVTFVGAASKKTNANGEVTFTINVKAANDQMIENLVANGITLAASVVQADGSKLSQTTQVMVKAPAAKDVTALTTSLSQPSISVLGGATVVAVKATDTNGGVLANKEIDFGLASGLSSRVKVDKTSATTNANGIAYFTVTVENGDDIDRLLVEKGITYAVSTYNNNSTSQPVVTQIGKVNISVPTEAMNLTMNTSKDDLLATGDTADVFAKLIDNTATGIKSYPVTFTVIDSALNGVTINGQETAVITTDTSGNAKASLKLTKVTGKQYTDLLANGVTVRASITLPNGVVRTQTVHFNVNEVFSKYHLVFSNVSKSQMDVNGDKSIVTVALLDQNNQPVRNQDVTLAANNSAGLIIGNPGSSAPSNTSGTPQTVKTDSNGNAFFSVAIDGATVDKQLLLASGIELTASHTDENSAKATQVYRIGTVDNSGTPTLQPARYSLRLASSKPTMNVRDDTADVTITLVDANGGGVAGQYVALSIDDLARNGAIIVGPSGLTTDTNGQAVFKIKVDETTRRNYTAVDFVNDDLHLTAHFNETGRIEATQIFAIDIVPAVVQTPKASIVIGVNPTEVASSNDGVYYTKNLSVSVVDFDGKPLANQTVTLDVTPLTYIKGRNLWALAPVSGAAPSKKWVFANEPYFNLSAPNIYLDSNGKPMNNMGTPTDFTDDIAASTTVNNVHACVADPNGTAVGVNNTPVKVVTFVSQSGNTQNTFTTDANGKFDFAMRYPKIYAQWLNVQIGASSTVASLPNRTTYNLGLAPLANDYSSDGTYSPNEVSPYGTSFTCP
ncbi:MULTISPECIES: beta strand repeat-containing protein [Acinetobacter]|uniref:beta strand repeat-containing protein n=1 Tax=Acinetobacter TaxID=469 RepID=UPI0002CF83DC|nr:MULTISPECIES: hypothetical protein [Acinetobacter]ENX64663.1 hypothetical protein F885_00007 [Acinetobacter higginsii]MCH7319796.1 hypothetical protein [Acinetobacter higginsii]